MIYKHLPILGGFMKKSATFIQSFLIMILLLVFDQILPAFADDPTIKIVKGEVLAHNYGTQYLKIIYSAKNLKETQMTQIRYRFFVIQRGDYLMSNAPMALPRSPRLSPAVLQSSAMTIFLSG